jgi:hypothetical protein
VGLFSKRAPTDDHASRWIRENGEIPRKTELTFVILTRIVAHPLGSADAYGQPLTADHMLDLETVVADVVMPQDAALMGRVARDSALLYESLGCLHDHRHHALEALGETLADDGGVSDPETAHLLTIAHVVNARSLDMPVSDAGLVAYQRLHEDATPAANARATRLAGRACVAVARLRNRGTISSDIPVFSAGRMTAATMKEAGWYPNPINAGDTSTGVPSVQRWWDGDWTDRVRLRNGRGWTENRVPVHTTPDN